MLPTLAQLNELSAAQNMLLLLRVLHTSDGLTKSYEILNNEALNEVLMLAVDLIVDGMGDETDWLSQEEVAEAETLSLEISEYLDR